MKLFLDTNIVMDHVLKRAEFCQPAGIILDLAKKQKLEILVSSITFVNAFYILRKYYDREMIYNSMKALLQVCTLTSIGQNEIALSLSAKWKDFEDCVQFHSASAAQVDFIITRNKKDFETADIPVLSPVEFLNQLTT